MTARQELINAMTIRALASEWAMIGDPLKLAKATIDDPVYSLGGRHFGYFVKLREKRGVALTRFKNDLTRALHALKQDPAMRQELVRALKFAHDKNLIDQQQLAAYATHAAITQSDLHLFLGNYLLAHYHLGVQWFEVQDPIVATVTTWQPIDARTNPYVPTSTNVTWFERPKSRRNFWLNDVTTPLYVASNATRPVGDLLLQLERVEYAIVRKPSNDIILFDGHPYDGGDPCGYVPQTLAGEHYSFANREISQYQEVMNIVIRDTVVGVLLKAPALRLTDDVTIDIEVTRPAAFPTPELTSQEAANQLGRHLVDNGIWSGGQSIKVVDPRLALERFEQFFTDLQDLPKVGVRIIRNPNDPWEMTVRPTIAEGDNNAAAQVVANELAMTHGVGGNWNWETDLVVVNATLLRTALEMGAIDHSHLRLSYDATAQHTLCRLDIIDPENDVQTQRVRAIFDVLGSMLLATRNGFSITRISIVSASQLLQYFFELIARTINGAYVQNSGVNKSIMQQCCEIADLIQALFSDQGTARQTLKDLKERAYNVDAKVPPPNLEYPKLVWEWEQEHVAMDEMQDARDALLEIVGVVGYDVAERKGFANDAIQRLTPQIIQRMTNAAIAGSPRHVAAWQSLNATEKLHYADNAIRRRAIATLKQDTRPNYLDTNTPE